MPSRRDGTTPYRRLIILRALAYLLKDDPRVQATFHKWAPEVGPDTRACTARATRLSRTLLRAAADAATVTALAKGLAFHYAQHAPRLDDKGRLYTVRGVPPETDAIIAWELGPMLGEDGATALLDIPPLQPLYISPVVTSFQVIRDYLAANRRILNRLEQELNALWTSTARARRKTGVRMPSEESVETLEQWTRWFYARELSPVPTPIAAIARKDLHGRCGDKSLQECPCRKKVYAGIETVRKLLGLSLA